MSKNIEICKAEEVGSQILDEQAKDISSVQERAKQYGISIASPDPSTAKITELRAVLSVFATKVMDVFNSFIAGLQSSVASLQATIVTLNASIAAYVAQIADMNSDIADAYDAVEDKGGTLPEQQTSANLPTAIDSIPSGGGYTGHVDEVGLRSIGWTDADIEWLISKVDWMEEEDEAYKVPQQLIDIYTANGGWSNDLLFAHKSQPYYKWSPRFDTTGIPVDYQHLRHNGATYCLAILDCYMQTNNFYNFFAGCASLKYVQNHSGTLYMDSLYSLVEMTSNNIQANMTGSATNCYNLIKFKGFGTVNLSGCGKLVDVKIDHAYSTCNFTAATQLSKESVLFAINNSAGNTATIKLNSQVLSAMQADADVQAALTNYPNITLST